MHPRFDGPCTLHPEATEIALYVLLTLLVCYILFSAFPLLMACQGARDRREAKKTSRQMAYELEGEEEEGVELKAFQQKSSARFFVEAVTEKSKLKGTPASAPVAALSDNKEEPEPASVVINVEGVDKASTGVDTDGAKGTEEK